MGIEQGIKQAARFALPAIIAGAGFFGCGRDSNTNVTAAVAPTTEVPPTPATQQISSSPTPEATPTIRPILEPTPTKIPVPTATETPRSTATGTATPQPPEATAIPEGPKFTPYDVYSGTFDDKLGGGFVMTLLPTGKMIVVIIKNFPCTGPVSSIEQLRYYQGGLAEANNFSSTSVWQGKFEAKLNEDGSVGVKLNEPGFSLQYQDKDLNCTRVSGASGRARKIGTGKDVFAGGYVDIWNKSQDYRKSPIGSGAALQDIQKRFGSLP